MFGRVAPFLVGVTLLFATVAARAQPVVTPDAPTDLNEGKTPAQLFAGDCAVCHNRPQGLAKDRGVRSLSSFLRQHYTSSVQTADALASYLASAGPGAAPAAAPGRRGAAGVEPSMIPRRGEGIPAIEIPSATSPRRASAPATEPGAPVVRPPGRVPGAVVRPEGPAAARPEEPTAARPPRRPASAEAPKPAAVAPQPVEQKPAPAPAIEIKPEPKPAPKPPLEEIFD